MEEYPAHKGSSGHMHITESAIADSDIKLRRAKPHEMHSPMIKRNAMRDMVLT